MLDGNFELLTHARYECRTLAQGVRMAETIARGCPAPAIQLPGIMELVLNAIEHGNLGISYEEKSVLITTGRWLDEIDRRSRMPEYKDRRVVATLERGEHDVMITIRDEGEGFNAKPFLDRSLADYTGVHGRGIALARTMCFDSIEYLGNGSEVRARVGYRAPHLQLEASYEIPVAVITTSETRNRGGADVGPRKPRVLIADDEPVTRMTLLGALRSKYDVELAADGKEALAKYERSRPDLILIDVNMPELTGVEVCERIRSREVEGRTPILLMSTQTDEAFVLDGLARGADDFIVKPYSQRILLLKLGAQLHGKHARDAVAHQRERLLELQRANAQEQFLAQAVLKNLLGRADLSHPSIRFLMTGITGFEGDVALVARLPSGGIRVMVSDVVGHGLPAALGTIPISLLFYSLTRRGGELGAAMREINNELYGVLPVGLFAAACAFEVDAAGSRLRIWNAGMPDIIVRRGASRNLVRIASQNVPVGVKLSEQVTVQEVDVTPGDIVFAMSDGVTETASRDGTLFGIDEVVTTLSADRPTEGLFDDLLSALFNFSQGEPQDDDITLLAHTIGA